MYSIDRELAALEDFTVIPTLASVTDQKQVERAIKTHGVDITFHVASHKHVPLVEANALERIRHNVFRTKTTADAAFSLGVTHFVLASTDNAVRRTTMKGATKRWAELIVHEQAALPRKNSTRQRSCAVRNGSSDLARRKDQSWKNS